MQRREQAAFRSESLMPANLSTALLLLLLLLLLAAASHSLISFSYLSASSGQSLSPHFCAACSTRARARMRGARGGRDAGEAGRMAWPSSSTISTRWLSPNGRLAMIWATHAAIEI